MTKLLFGTDPEVFAVYTDTVDYDAFIGNKFVLSPAILLEQGVKPVSGDWKHPVFVQTDISSIIMDGAAIEFNFNRPFENAKEMYDNVHKTLDDTRKFIESVGLEMYTKPMVNFDYKKYWDPKKFMKNRTYEQGFIFGCDPDKDAFNVEWSCSIMNVSTHPYRYGGGHFHVSGSRMFEQYYNIAVMIMAIYVGNYCVYHSPNPVEDSKRAQYYGMPGKFRQQKYKDGSTGIEYRTPSNSWLSYDFDTFNGMVNMAVKAVEVMENPEIGQKVLENFVDRTVTSISQFNQELSGEILDELGGY